MEDRILAGYQFITKNYRAGDRLYIFGFSRGAHQARALAGLLAYAGIPANTNQNDSRLLKIGNEILDLSKNQSDEENLASWQAWTPLKSPVLAKEIHEEIGETMVPVEIQFLGVWDTVPGSSFKNYGACKEQIGFWKTSAHWLPMISSGERYKTDSYPAIHFIAHAVSMDEKRSKFQPILLCAPINASFTQTQEVWFPGAHADVGGGYEDSQELSDIPLGWMLKNLGEHYVFNQAPAHIGGSPTGLAHWSMGDRPANFGSDCVDRKIPEGASIDDSRKSRQQYGPVQIRINGKTEEKLYPLNCADVSR